MARVGEITGPAGCMWRILRLPPLLLLSSQAGTADFIRVACAGFWLLLCYVVLRCRGQRSARMVNAEQSEVFTSKLKGWEDDDCLASMRTWFKSPD